MADIVLKTVIREGNQPRFALRLLPSRILQVFRTWRERRRARRRLADLDDWLLRDIGFGRAEALREVRKSFPWHKSFPWARGPANSIDPWR